jgi:hypothetical protein
MEHKFNADELFKIVIDTTAIFPLNVDFILKANATNNLPGQGIYFLYYKEELIYIGYFNPSEKNRDARLERMKKEMATITMRGLQVVFTQSSSVAHQQSVNYPIFQGNISDNGFQTSVNRVNFADTHWDAFKINDFLSEFTFYWFPEEKNLGNTKDELEHLTNQLRKFYNPTCNG